MKRDILLIGVGGEGVLTSQVIIARAANLEGHYVRGVQLHGLAQRGGSVPTSVRFGSKRWISSPHIMQANADLVIAFEPLEAVRAVYFAHKDKTNFIINQDPHPPVYSYVLKIPYPSQKDIKKRIKPFAKSIHTLNASEIAKKEFGKDIFANSVLIGVAFGLGFLPIKEENLRKAIGISAPRALSENIKAFQIGIDYFRKR